ncbi:MAG TPA: M12 family metallo-peptidase [Ignavibacteria bacterium]|nr:M12 family metallo-peptidase [Ignavibacteria bacterium]
MKTLTNLLIAIFVLSSMNIEMSKDGIVFNPAYVYSQQENSVWKDKADFSANEFSNVKPQEFRYLNLNMFSLANILNSSPFEFSDRATSSPLIIELPHPDGGMLKFYVTEYSMMEQGLADQFPGYKTYNVKGIDDPYAVGKIDITSAGFHGMIMTPKGDYFIDPVSLDNTENYISYFKSDFISAQPFECLVNEVADNSEFINSYNSDVTGQQLRTYRLACAATGEYTAVFGGTVAAGQAAIVTAINRVNGVYEREFSVRMTLIANNSLLVYTNAATDPYTNSNGVTMLGQNQTNITAVIGSANYDFGHVFSTGGGGVASLGVICSSSSKARGVTGLPSPVGDPFYIDYVAHEMGHQFRGNHSFNGNSGSCAGGNRNSTTAWEPGSASTIMGYAGICSPQNLQSNSDDYFHSGNVSEITAFTQTGTGNNCPVITNTGNTPPDVTVPAGGFTIPINTPFELTGSATDNETQGSLTYCWEEFDLGAAGAPTAPVGNAPIFRSFSPVTTPTRIFPKLSDLLNNTSTIGEILPSYTRSLSFRLTVRDNSAGGGGINFNTLAFNVSSTAGPFIVGSPNSAVTWAAGPQTVGWNVAGTNIAPVNCANVDILLSTDGGVTFPVTLLANTPNDGSQSVTIPNISTTTARVKVKANGNVFFDISDVNFTITGGPAPLPCTDFASGTFPPAYFSIDYTGTNYWSRNDVSAYGTGSGSAKFDFYTAGNNENQSIVSDDFDPSVAGTYLTFDEAYAPYTNSDFGPDTLLVEASNNSGGSYTVLATLTGRADGTGELNTAPANANSYTPANSEWAPKIYALPAGTNKVRLKAKSGWGNNLYIDNLCVQTLPEAVNSSVGVYPQGFYRGTPGIYDISRDTVRLYLHRMDFPNVIADSAVVYLSLDGIVNTIFSKALSGSYYIEVNHRNSIETWSLTDIAYARGTTFNYDIAYLNNAYGGNQYLSPTPDYWGMFGGDVDQNGFVDLSDVNSVNNDANIFAAGYVTTDVTGNNATDLSDVLLTYNNNANFVQKQTPPGAAPLLRPVININRNPVFENDAQRQKYEAGLKIKSNRTETELNQIIPDWSPMPSTEYMNRLNEVRIEKIIKVNTNNRRR